MIAGVGWTTVALATVIIVVAGATNGIAGFGFAVVGTMALASLIDPATAVVFMIIPVFAVNLSLVRELSGDDLRSCGQRFGPVIGAALVGTVIGMAALRSIPSEPFRVVLGVLTLGFVATSQRHVPISLGSTRHKSLSHSVPGMVGIGSVSGLLFGGTNVGVQLIAYLRSFDLSHGLFVGVVAMVFLGLNAIRVAIAGLLGLYPNAAVFVASVVAAIPAVIGVAVGKRLRVVISQRLRRFVVLGLLAIVGVRLVGGGLGIL
jgi:uncharacterized membrane protein YfcA